MTENDTNDYLYSASDDEQDSEFTQEEIQDILRLAAEQGLNITNTAQLIKFVRDVRAAHTQRAHEQGKSTHWPTQK
jgi:hypothetical protein